MLRIAFAGCLWWLAQTGTLPAADRLVISEFLAINNTGDRDDDDDRSDWIELHNPGSRLVQLEGWALTDRRRQLLRWRFPVVELPAGGYLIVYASGKDRAVTGQPLHASFKLKGEGDYLALVGPDGSVADEFAPAYPKQKSNVSYGLTAAGTRDFLLHPTPGEPNEAAREGKVARVKLSHPRGLQEWPFRLALATATDGAEIRYTLDGTAPTLANGLAYNGPLEIARTTVVRAAAFKAGHAPADTETHTFLFPADVIRQSADGLPPAGWPYSWGPKRVNYGMDPKVVDDPRFRDEIVPALRAIPSFSLVLNLDDLFNEQNGIYVNSGRSGRENERPVSVEYLAAGDTPGFQIDAGIRIRGGFSRMPMNPKHAFRLFFRKEYGEGKLRFPLFGPAAAQEFSSLDLRTFQNYSWSFQADPRGVFLRDQFNRDLQLAMGQPGARGDYCHLYINGVYWGLYNTCERPEASYGATYFGGREDDYDVIKVDSGFGEHGMNSFSTIVTDGNLEAWKELHELAKQGLADPARYQRLLGNHPDGTRNHAYPVLLDPGNLIDYMLIIIYGGNMDAPITKFGGDARPNNWYGIRSRTGEHGFRFFVWDAEHTFLDVNEDRTGPFPAGNELDTSNPQWLWQQCLDNADFRMLVADHVHRHFFHGGLLTAASVAERFQRRAAEIESAVIGESARWGDTEAGFPMGTPPRLNAQGELLAGPLNRDDDWRVEIGRLLKEYIPRRSDVVLAQLYSHGLVPDVPAPQVSSEGMTVTLASSVGEIFYTLDGSDPRRAGGTVAATARRAEAAISQAAGQTLRARTRLGDDWSAAVELAK
jgi:hypothetical protein